MTDQSDDRCDYQRCRGGERGTSDPEIQRRSEEQGESGNSDCGDEMQHRAQTSKPDNGGQLVQRRRVRATQETAAPGAKDPGTTGQPSRALDLTLLHRSRQLCIQLRFRCKVYSDSFSRIARVELPIFCQRKSLPAAGEQEISA